MLLRILVIGLAAGLMPVLLFYEKKESMAGLLPSKVSLSLLFVLAALIPPHPDFIYFLCMFAGLVLCLIGDICLVFRQKKVFLVGLIFFLFGHILYILGFVSVSRIKLWTWVGLALILAVGCRIYRWLAPHLGNMRIPVLVYTVVISIMLAAAWSVLGGTNLALSARVIIFSGAFCFYISDIFVARDRFMKKDFSNRVFGLPLYYTGQFLLAFSVSFLKLS